MGLRTFLGLKTPYAERIKASLATAEPPPLLFNEITWEGVSTMDVGGVRFSLRPRDVTQKTTDDAVVLLKSRDVIEEYRRLFEGERIGNIFEYGTFEGGSPIFFACATNATKIVGIDTRNPAENVQRQTDRFSDRLRIFYGTSQSDAETVHRIIDENFIGPIDLVIDDASHLYSYTKAAFEIAFSRLRVGGTYVIEDWNWAHYAVPKTDGKWKDQPALSNLAFEIAMAVGSDSAISSMEARSWALIIKKGRETGPDFRLDDAIRLGPNRTFRHI